MLTPFFLLVWYMYDSESNHSLIESKVMSSYARQQFSNQNEWKAQCTIQQRLHADRRSAATVGSADAKCVTNTRHNSMIKRYELWSVTVEQQRKKDTIYNGWWALYISTHTHTHTWSVTENTVCEWGGGSKLWAGCGWGLPFLSHFR